MGRIILPPKLRSHSIYLFVSDDCKPCMDLLKHLKNMRDGILNAVSLIDLSQWGGSGPIAVKLVYKHNITRVPTLIVVNHILDIEEERIKGDKKIAQNIHRILKKYWTKNE